MEAYIKSLELKRGNKLFRVPEFRKYTRAAGALLFYWLAKTEYTRQMELMEAKLKKERMSMPVYEMKPEDYTSPPWAGENYEDWKYRLIKVSGREIHNKYIPIPKKLNNYRGYAYFVPVAHSEDSALQNKVGIFVNKGWLPHEYKLLTHRPRIENSFTKVEHIGFLNKGEEYSRFNFWKKGNAFDEQRWEWNNFHLRDMAKAVNFNNAKAMKEAVIEVVNTTETPMDANNPLHYVRDMSLTQEFPHPKTFAGVLQPHESHSETLTRQMVYGIVGTALLWY